jgi:hypothetical protein
MQRGEAQDPQEMDTPPSKPENMSGSISQTPWGARFRGRTSPRPPSLGCTDIVLQRRMNEEYILSGDQVRVRRKATTWTPKGIILKH